MAGPVQSGCLSFGSLLTTVRRQSATRHRLVAVRPSATSAPWRRGKPPRMASRSHGLGHHCLAFASSAANLAGSRPQVLVNRPAYRRSASIRRLARRTGIRQNLCNSSQGGAGVARSNIYQQSKVDLSSAAVPSRPSLTCRSSRHPQVSLVGSLRASRSGAAYLWR